MVAPIVSSTVIFKTFAPFHIASRGAGFRNPDCDKPLSFVRPSLDLVGEISLLAIKASTLPARDLLSFADGARRLPKAR